MMGSREASIDGLASKNHTLFVSLSSSLTCWIWTHNHTWMLAQVEQQQPPSPQHQQKPPSPPQQKPPPQQQQSWLSNYLILNFWGAIFLSKTSFSTFVSSWNEKQLKYHFWFNKWWRLEKMDHCIFWFATRGQCIKGKQCQHIAI